MDAILYDLAADFDWDTKLDEAFKKRALAEGRMDLLAED